MKTPKKVIKSYVFDDPEGGQNIGLYDAEEIIKNDRQIIINEILSMYVPNGNPEVWRDKIIKLRKSLA